MKRIPAWFVSCLLVVSRAFGETPPALVATPREAAPSIVINNNFAGSAPAAAVAPLPVIVATPAAPQGTSVVAQPAVAASAVATENEPEGISVGLHLGYLSSEGRGAFGTVGVSPQVRFLRFLSLEGEVNLGVAALDGCCPGGGHNRESKDQPRPYSASLQMMGQLTFHSALLDVTPRVGLGVMARDSQSSLYSGPYSVLGAEVKISSLRLAADLRQKIGSPAPVYASSVTSAAYGNYPYYFMPMDPVLHTPTSQLNLSASWDLSERSRLGARLQSWGASGQIQLFYRFGF